jgi:hypothetical protein
MSPQRTSLELHRRDSSSPGWAVSCALFLTPLGPRGRTIDKKITTDIKGRKMKKLTRRAFVTGSAALLCAPPEKTEAQSSWPARPIRIIVPYPAGGQTDGIARAFGDYLARQHGGNEVAEAFD